MTRPRMYILPQADPDEYLSAGDREIVTAVRRYYAKLGAALIVIDGGDVLVASRASTPGAKTRPATQFLWADKKLTLVSRNCVLELQDEGGRTR